VNCSAGLVGTGFGPAAGIFADQGVFVCPEEQIAAESAAVKMIVFDMDEGSFFVRGTDMIFHQLQFGVGNVFDEFFFGQHRFGD